MKIIHTSDWHLGHVLYNYDRSEEQRSMLEQIAKVCADQQPDALLVCGDVYHNAAPSAAAQQLLVDGLLAMHEACPDMRIIVTAGNHDSAARLEATARLWQLAGIIIVGHAARNNDGSTDLDRHIIELPGKGWVVAVPHLYPVNFPAPPETTRDERPQYFFNAVLQRVADRNTEHLPVVLMAHLAVTGSDFTGHDNIGTLDAMTLDTLGHGYDYAALGHIHRPQTLEGSNGRARYCGTPLPVSFDEQCEHSVSIVQLDAHNTPKINTQHIVNVHPLHTIPAGDPVPLDEALNRLKQFSDNEPAYIRLNISTTGYVPFDACEKAANAIDGKQCRFTTLKVTTPTSNNADATSHISVEQLREMTPLDVAENYIKRKTGTAMTDEQKAMLNEAINLQQEGG